MKNILTILKLTALFLLPLYSACGYAGAIYLDCYSGMGVRQAYAWKNDSAIETDKEYQKKFDAFKERYGTSPFTKKGAKQVFAMEGPYLKIFVADAYTGVDYKAIMPILTLACDHNNQCRNFYWPSAFNKEEEAKEFCDTLKMVCQKTTNNKDSFPFGSYSASGARSGYVYNFDVLFGGVSDRPNTYNCISGKSH